MTDEKKTTTKIQAPESTPEKTDVGELHGPILRERIDPREGYEPVPMWFIALCGAIVFWAGWYLAEYGGGGQSGILDPRPEARFPAGAGAGGAPVDPIVLGKKLFTANCVSCHQQSGQGVPGQYPPLAGSEWVTGRPAVLKRILLHGLEGPISVRGESYDGNMPALGQRLKDEHIAAVLTYIRATWGNQADAIPAESVAATRAATADRRGEWTAPELEAIQTSDWEPPEKEEAPKKHEPPKERR